MFEYMITNNLLESGKRAYYLQDNYVDVYMYVNFFVYRHNITISWMFTFICTGRPKKNETLFLALSLDQKEEG